MTDQISLSEQSIRRLIVAYREAVDNNHASFKFEGVEFLTAYAKYFLLHWAPQYGVTFEP